MPSDTLDTKIQVQEVNIMKAQKRKVDKELVLACALLSFMMAETLVLGTLYFFGLSVYQCDAVVLLGWMLCLWGGGWGALLWRMC